MQDIKQILIKNGFRFNKSLGQNFLTDDYLLADIVTKAEILPTDTVVEIGTGAGTLTRQLAKVAKKVYTFELDENLKPVLKETLQGLDNVEVIFRDVLKLKDEEIKDIVGENFKVVANIPYYITTPLIMRFIESSLSVLSITVTIQLEVAKRLVAKCNTSDYGVITVAVGLKGNAEIVKMVDKNYFYPVPKVDSAVVKIDIDKEKYKDVDHKKLMRLVKCSFAMRRKVLTNNLKVGYKLDRLTSEKILENLGLNPKVRGEVLSIDDFIKLQKEIDKLN